MPASNPDLSNKTTPFRLEYLRCKQTNAPVGEGEKDEAGSKKGKMEGLKQRREGNKQASRWCDGDEEEAGMTGK